MKGIRPTKADARDKRFRVERLFGSTPLPEEYVVPGFDAVFPDQNADNRPSGCTSYTIAQIGALEDGRAYSHDYQFMKTLEVMGVPPDTDGADARVAFKVPCTFGLLPKDKEPMEMGMNTQAWAATPTNWDLALDTEAKKNLKPAYLPIGKNPDYFDGIRNALILGQAEKRTVGMATQWSPDFGNVNYLRYAQNALTDAPKNLYWGHMYECGGYKTILGSPYLILKTWEGGHIGFKYMSRALCNSLMGTMGAYAATIKDIPEGTLDELRTEKANFVDVCLALLQNLLLKLRYGIS